MSREGAETYLRGLAEAELRRSASQPWDSAPQANSTVRVKRVAEVLTFVGALDDGIADQILDDFELALDARQTGQTASVRGWFSQRAAGRARLARRVSVPPAAAGRLAAAGSGTGTAAGRTHAPVPLRQIVRACDADVYSEVYLLSYARVASGPQFSVFARIRQLPGPWEPSGPRLFDPFTATDDQGTSYQVTIRDIGSPVLGWTLMLRPDPPHDPQWLDLATTAGGPAARIILPAAGGKTWPPAADVTVSQTAPSPGERLLSTIAARLLAAVPPLPNDPWLYGTAPRPRALPSITDGLGDLIAALQHCGALPPLSPVPGQLAALCARLNLSGHGHHHAARPRPSRPLAQRAHAIPPQGNWGGAGAGRLRRRGRRPARTGRNPAHDPWPAQLRGQQHPTYARHRPGVSHSLRAERTLFLATDMDMRQRPALARHPHQRPERNEQRNRATPGNSATTEPHHDLDPGAGDRAINSGPRQNPAPLAITLARQPGTSGAACR